MILGSHCSCRYSRPLAAPSDIPFLVIQFSGGFPVIGFVRTKLTSGHVGFFVLKPYPKEKRYKFENQMQVVLYYYYFELKFPTSIVRMSATPGKKNFKNNLYLLMNGGYVTNSLLF